MTVRVITADNQASKRCPGLCSSRNACTRARIRDRNGLEGSTQQTHVVEVYYYHSGSHVRRTVVTAAGPGCAAHDGAWPELPSPCALHH